MIARELLTTHDAARVLRISHAKLSQLLKSSAIPHIVLPGGAVRFDAGDLQKWAGTFKREPIAETAT